MGVYQGTRKIAGRVKRYLLRKSPAGRQERTATALMRTFASFVVHDGRTTPRELEIVFDFARNVFPEIDHGILGRQLEEAIASDLSMEPDLKVLNKTLPSAQKTAFAMQLYSVVRAGGDEDSERERFLEIMDALGDQSLGEVVITELSQRDAPKNKRLTQVDFGVADSNDVRLASGDDSPHFRCYQAGGLMLIRNLAATPLSIRGHAVDQGRLLQIRPSDEVIAGRWRLGYNDLAFFLQVEEKGENPALFLIPEEGELTLSRSKSRLALAKLVFGHRVSLTPLLDDKLANEEHETLENGQSYDLDYHNLIRVEGQDSLSLESLLRLSQQTGQRFVLPGGKRKVRVSNNPSELSGDSLLLTPGLAGNFVLEMEFDPATGVGELNVLESAQIILANGEPIKTGELKDGAKIQLSSRQSLRCRFSENILDEERNLVRFLEVENLNHSFWKGGKAIDSLSLKVERGQMMCIIGPSGSGKSTLLEILAGQRKAQSGHVRLNGISLYEKQRRLSPLISFMPQEEALSAQLTAREHLAHACAIRRPHLAEKSIQKRVSHLLGDLGLERIGSRMVGSAESKSLSGGERSRLNAGLDLIGGGEVFLFDEPISGLSSKDAEHVVEALHGLAQDKIVVASLHRPSEKVLEAFDLVLLLDRGGKMAFYGPPSALLHYFENASEELDIPRLETGNQRGADFVFDVLEAPMLQLNSAVKSKRRFPPEFWQERFENHRVMAHLRGAIASKTTGAGEMPTADDKVPAPEPPQQGRRQKWMIFKTHLARSLKSKFRHRGTFYSILLEAPLLALLIGATLRASAEGSYEFHSALHLPSYLFLAVTVAMFFGLTNSATEVLRDRPMLRRERNCRPHPLLYLGAKFLVLTVLVTLQSAVFIAVGLQILEIHDMFTVHLSWMVLTGCCGTALALLISVLARSERTALGAIPLILVPQILLAGALIPFKEMNRGLFQNGDKGREWGAEPVPSTIMPLRYAYEGAIVSQASKNSFEKARRPLQERIDTLKENESLNETESEGFEKDKERLRVLYSAAGSDLEQAHTFLKDPLGEMERTIDDEVDEEAIPVAQFFVNERIENMVQLAETSRLDNRRTERPHVFLAESKPIFGFTMGTLTYCRIFLLTLTAAFILAATSLLKLSLTRG